jgi:hypothetical protein
MIEIIKRLEIIKSSILIEDIEIIELQIMKLSSQNIDVDVKNIILKLENSEYSLALDLIENYISQHTGLVLYEDKELLSLKFELKQLEIKFQDLIEEKTKYLNEIDEFNKEYNLHLGELIKYILNLDEGTFVHFLKNISKERAPTLPKPIERAKYISAVSPTLINTALLELLINSSISKGTPLINNS